MSEQPTGSLETRKDAGSDQSGQVKLWLDAIAIADKEEEGWRKKAEEAGDLYTDKKARSQRRFNILYSNIETICPALYNSDPAPDVRRRYGDRDDAGKTAAQVIERALAYSIDAYDFSSCMSAAVKDMQLPGRGVTRVRYAPVVIEEYTHDQVFCETVPWQDFRRGPGRTWADVPWIAFRHHLTREQMVALNPKIGGAISLDTTVEGYDESKSDSPPPDIFKRGCVWEIWDKEKRQVVFVAPAYKEAPLHTAEDPLSLQGFFPIPRPLYDLECTDSLVPVVPYELYKDQAEELDRLTRRITSLIAVMKWRGIFAASGAAESNVMAQLKNAPDGELVPAENLVGVLASGGGLEKAIWLMPIEQAAATLAQLYQQRDQIKQVIYEITGIADILRGSTQASETATAQQIKAQWGSLRLQKKQGEVARYARDLMRIMAEIICDKFSPEALQMMTGIQITPDVVQLLKSDVLRDYRIDIETDSTIRADLTRAQENMSAFLQGFAQYIQAVGPAVQQGAMPMDVATDLLTSFARAFKLGKQAEDALERLGQKAQDGSAAMASQQQSAQQAQAQQAQLEQARTQGQMQVEQVKGQAAMMQAQTEQAKAQQEAEYAQAEHALRMEELQLKQQMAREKHQMDMAKLAAQAAMPKPAKPAAARQ